MPIIGKLVELYQVHGIAICTGLSSHDFDDLPSAPFTRFIKDGRSMTGGFGIALQEIYLLENLFASYRPRHVLIIGNSLGWSTLATALLLPESRVVAIDSGFDNNSLHGIELTNQIAKEAGLQIRVVKGVSPQDVSAVVDTELDGRIDFAFIDGMHTNDQVVLDFVAVSQKAAAHAVYLFHDVHLFDLYDGIGRIERLAGQTAQRLRATPSGMVLLYDPAQYPALREAIAPFSPSPEAITMIEREGWRHRHPHHGRWRRSLIKRINTLRRMAGIEPLFLPSKL